MKSQEKIAVLIGDVALPLAGFFFWNWGFYFIALYLLLDQLVKQLFLLIRFKNNHLSKNEKGIYLAKSMLLFLFELSVVLLINYQITTDFNPIAGFVNFLSYEDMGIQQGLVLIPLLFFAEWMKIKTEQRQNLSDELKRDNLKRALQQAQVRLAFMGFVLALVNFGLYAESIIVFLFLTGIGLTVFVPFIKRQHG